MKNKYVQFILLNICGLALYLILLNAYYVVFDGIIFFVTVGVSILTASVIFCFQEYKKLFDRFIHMLMSLIIFLNLFAFSVFIPVFLERSLSYHIIFYVAQNKQVSYKELEKEFAVPEFDKRIKELSVSGFIKKQGDNYITTPNGIFFETLMKPIQKITPSEPKYVNRKKSK